VHKSIGLGAMVRESAAEADRVIAGLRSRSHTTLPAATPALALRPYQIECVEALRGAYGTGYRAPILQLATGGGKTVVFARVALGAHAKGLCVVVLVHRRELIRQASAELAWAGVPHGIIAAGFPANPDELVQVASVQTLARRRKTLTEVDLFIIDEAHHARAGLWRKVLDDHPGARLLGVTATPVRLDGRGLGVEAGGVFDALVTGPTIPELIADGYLAPTRCFVPQRRLDLAGIKSRAGDYVTSDLAACIDQPEIAGDAVEQYRRHADHQPAIVYCCDVRHAERIAVTFRCAGYRAACVHGGTNVAHRDRLIAGLGNNKLELLTSCDLISEGIDVPCVGAVILLRPTKSLTLYLQQVGRGMRPAAGKDALVVLDHAGNVITHGLPDRDRAWSLSGVETLRHRTVTISQNGEVVNRRREIAEVADELTELTADPLAAVEEMSYWQVVTGGLSEAELRHYARSRGYKPEWVHHRLLEQQRRAA
jgi:superfamily II DNA or RNA helicase